MNTILQDNLYLILIVVGGVLVSIQSRTLYSTPLLRENANWLEKELPLQDFIGKRRFEIGYLFYLCPILLIYLMISVSPELLNLSMGVAGTSASVGALSLSVSDASTFAPILAAVAVNTLTSVRPVSILEQYIRGISHSIAGIPHYLQRMIRKIRETTQNLDSLPLDSENLSQQSLVSKKRSGLQQNIRSIRHLHELTLGSTGSQIWSGQAMAILDTKCKGLNDEYNQFLVKIRSFNAGRKQLPADGSPEYPDDDSGEIVLLSTNLRKKYVELLAIVIANQDEPLSPVKESPELNNLLKNLVSDGQRIRRDRALVRICLASTLTGIGFCLLPATLFYFTLFVIDDWSMQNFSLHSDENTLLIRGMPLGEYFQSTLFTGLKLAWWNVLAVCLLFGAGCTAALGYRANLCRVGQWEPWSEDSHPVGQYAVISLFAVLFAAFALEAVLFLKLVVLPAGSFSGASQFTSVLQDFNLNYVEYGYYSLLAAPFAMLICYLSDKLNISGEEGKSTALLQLDRILCITVIGGMVGHIGIRVFLDGTQNLQTTLLGSIVTTFVLFTLTWLYWMQGLEYQRKTRKFIDGNKLGMKKEKRERNQGSETQIGDAQTTHRGTKENSFRNGENKHVEV